MDVTREQLRLLNKHPVWWDALAPSPVWKLAQVSGRWREPYKYGRVMLSLCRLMEKNGEFKALEAMGQPAVDARIRALEPLLCAEIAPGTPISEMPWEKVQQFLLNAEELEKRQAPEWKLAAWRMQFNGYDVHQAAAVARFIVALRTRGEEAELAESRGMWTRLFKHEQDACTAALREFCQK